MTITVATNNARIRYTATSGQTAFAIPFEFFENDEIYVYVAATTLVAADEKTQGTGSTHYAVSGGGGSTGTVTFVTGITESYIVTIVRDIPIERITDFTAGSTINRAALNTQLDTLTAMVGDLKDKSDRAIRLQPYDSEISLFLPTIANRAGKIFGFDTNGNLTADTAANFDITLDDLVMNTMTMSGNANSKVNLTAVLDSQIVTNGAVLNLKSTKSSNTADIKLDGSTTYGIDLNAGNKAIRLQDATLFSSTAEVTGALTAPLIVSQSGGSITLQPTGNQVYIKGTGGESRITFHNPAAPSMEFTGDSSIIGSGTFLLDVAGDITLDAAGDQIFFKDNGTLRLTFNIGAAGTSIQSASVLTIKATSSDINLQPEGGQVNIIGTSGQARFQFDNAASPTMKYSQNSNTTTLGVVDPTGTRTLLFPDESGTIHSSGGATTHANITVSTDGKVQFRDSAIYIQSGADGHLDLVADTEIHIAATTVNVDGLMDISGNLSVGGNFDVTGTIDFSDSNITNVGLISLDKITNDGSAGITLDSSAGIVIDSSTGQIVFKDDNVTRLTVAVNSGSTQSITSVAGLKLNSGADITLEADGGQVYITDPSGNDNFQFNGASSPTLGIHQNSNVTNLGLVDPTATRTILFPDASDTLVGKATTDTLTNKTLTAPTLTGTTVVASLDISGDIDVDGTTNLDVVDIDGAVDMASTLAVTGVVTANAGVVVDNFTLDGTSLSLSSGVMTINAADVRIKNVANDETMAQFDDDGAVNLYNNNELSLSTVAGGSVGIYNDLSLTSDGGIINIGAGNDLKITHDGTNGDFESAGNLTFDVAGNITLDADGNNITLKDGGTDYGNFTKSSNSFVVQSTISDGDILFKGNDSDGSNPTTALTLDMSDAGTATFNSHVRLGDNKTASFGAGNDIEITSDGTNGTIAAGSGNLLVDVVGDIILDSDSANWRFKDDGTSILEIGSVSSGPSFYSAQSNADMLFKGNDGGSPITALTLDMENAGTATFNNSIFVPNNGVAIGSSNDQAFDLNVTGFSVFQADDSSTVDTNGQIKILGVGSGVDAQISMATASNGRKTYVDDSDTNTLRFSGGNGKNHSSDMKISNVGNVVIGGSLSKGSGSFKIRHPLEAKKDTHYLVHSFVEGPQADNIYRGKVDLVSGSATQNIDTVAGMSEGTFDVLNREVQCFTTNESGWTAIKGSVSGNILTITAQEDSCTDTISWMVIGERKDPHMMSKHTNWTDSDGKIIIEPELTDKEKSENTEYDPHCGC